jgi:hypothetical protein
VSDAPDRRGRTVRLRGQSNLLAVAAALLAITAATALSVGMADVAVSGTDRPASERRVAVSLSERLVAPGSPLSARANVLNRTAVLGIDEAQLRSTFPVVGDRPVRVRIDDRTVVASGDPSGPTIRRVVLLQDREPVTVTPAVGNGTVRLPRRTPRVTLRLDPPNGTTVSAVRVGERVVLRNRTGLSGTFSIRTSSYRNVTLAVASSGPLPDGSVEVTYYPPTTTKAVLEVTVGER